MWPKIGTSCTGGLILNSWCIYEDVLSTSPVRTYELITTMGHGGNNVVHCYKPENLDNTEVEDDLLTIGTLCCSP